METRIAEGVARIFHCMAWADMVETRGESLAGCKIEDIAPATTPEALAAAWRAIGRLEQSEGVGVLCLLQDVADTNGYTDTGDCVDEFAIALALQLLGATTPFERFDKWPIGSHPYVEFTYDADIDAKEGEPT
jgi:hypothetical protein